MSMFLDYDKSVNSSILGNLSNESLDVPDLANSKRKFDVSLNGTPVSDKTSLNTFGLTPYFSTKLPNPRTRREKRSTSRGHF